ncbi:hypothetical protein [Salinirubrum litoreum]|uniref:Uncharacterized protein n=1 Tax=Salinirubrum litoreum TaxID=1126234 RepID=A0ABD5R9N0_9EURY|nr:hypothetical protein [Salinirubrum litoreum]
MVLGHMGRPDQTRPDDAPSDTEEGWGNSTPTRTLDLTIRVGPARGEQSENGDPIPIPADPDDLSAGDDALLSWLAEAPANRARFVLDHAGALRAADPDLPRPTLDAVERARRRGRGGSRGLSLPGVELRSLSVVVSEGGD